MDTHDIIRRVLIQRTERYTDSGPLLPPATSARFRLESSRLRVAYATAPNGESMALVRAILRYAQPRRLQVHWTVVPATPGDGELIPSLLASRFELIENLLLMAHEGPLEAPMPGHVWIAPITTWEGVWNYEVGSRRCFYDDPHPTDERVRHRASDRWREIERGWCRYYAAVVNGMQVGGCYVSLFEDIPTIMGVYTLPEARNQGIATALLIRTVRDIIRPGNEVVCLYVEHGNPAERLYRQLGFAPLIDTHTYAWEPC
jgi:GNAT superfamily N-acetyltransferase